MPKYFGAHVSASGGLENALVMGKDLGVNTIQMHAAPPQKWNSKAAATGVEDKFLELQPSSGIDKIFFHGIYLINLANPDPQKLHLSKLSLVNSLDLMARIKGDGVIFHTGSLKDEPNQYTGFRRAADAINWILDASKNKARLILEVAAGSGDIIGKRMEELAEIYSMVECKERVGFGLDSQHMWASGYNLKAELDSIVADVERIFTLDKVWAIHLNDSKTELGSRKDRHENIGEGLIGQSTLENFFTHPKLKEIPFILETPAVKSTEGALAEVNKLRTMLTS